MTIPIMIIPNDNPDNDNPDNDNHDNDNHDNDNPDNDNPDNENPDNDNPDNDNPDNDNHDFCVQPCLADRDSWPNIWLKAGSPIAIPNPNVAKAVGSQCRNRNLLRSQRVFAAFPFLGKSTIGHGLIDNRSRDNRQYVTG